MKNNKGFTLIELLGVIVVLVAILLVAIPSVASTFERNKDKIDKHKKEIILNAAEVYVSLELKKDKTKHNKFINGNCGIRVSTLVSNGLLTDDEISTNAGTYYDSYYIKYDNTYKIYKLESSGTDC